MEFIKKGNSYMLQRSYARIEEVLPFLQKTGPPLAPLPLCVSLPL